MCSSCPGCPQSQCQRVTFSPLLYWALSQSVAKLGFLSQAPGCACRTVSLPPSVTGAVLVPGGGDVKIESQKLNFKEKAQAKVGSLDNVGHLPAGGAVKVVSGSPRGPLGTGGACGGVWGPAGGRCHRPSVSSGAMSPYHCCFPIIIRPGRGRRGKEAQAGDSLLRTMACLPVWAHLSHFQRSWGWGTGPPRRVGCTVVVPSYVVRGGVGTCSLSVCVPGLGARGQVLSHPRQRPGVHVPPGGRPAARLGQGCGGVLG